MIGDRDARTRTLIEATASAMSNAQLAELGAVPWMRDERSRLPPLAFALGGAEVYVVRGDGDLDGLVGRCNTYPED